MRARWAILATVAALGLAVLPATGAAAKKGGPEPDPPVMVTMALAGAGLSTTCTGPLEMNRTSARSLRLDWEPTGQRIGIELPLAWQRSYPPSGGDTFTGCHGGLLNGSAEGFGGYLILSSTPDGDLVVSIRTDYFWGTETKGRRTTAVLRELIEVGGVLERTDGQPFDWSGSGEVQAVTGSLALDLFDKSTGWISFGQTDVTMTVTIDG